MNQPSRSLIAAGLLACAGLAQATTHLETTALTLDNVSVGYMDDAVLLSDVNHVATFGLSDLQRTVNWSVGGTGSNDDGDYGFSAYHIGLRSGYKVTRVEFSGTIVGELMPAAGGESTDWYRSSPGEAHNGSVLSLATGDDVWSGAHGHQETQVVDVNGSQAFSLLGNTGPLEHDFVASIGASVHVSSEPGMWYRINDEAPIVYTDSSAALHMENGQLRITYAAVVPEPGAYVMLLAGLAMVGALARRRAQA